MECLGGTLEVKSKKDVKTVFKIYFEVRKILNFNNVGQLLIYLIVVLGSRKGR